MRGCRDWTRRSSCSRGRCATRRDLCGRASCIPRWTPSADRNGGLERMRAEMQALEDAVNTETVGASHQVEILSQMLNRVDGRMLAANDQAELHRPVTPSCPCQAIRASLSRSCRGRVHGSTKARDGHWTVRAQARGVLDGLWNAGPDGGR